ncbi:MAG: pectate lyase [Niabella sp.]|nr:pectate lyase [Niabella sp.]
MKFFLSLLLSFVFVAANGQKPKPTKPILPVSVEKGQLIYNADSITGDRIPDYSYCGYKASEAAIPLVPVKAVVPVKAGDATASIQAAIDYVAALRPDNDGFRGAVLLQKGIYAISGQLVIRQSGIVLRGSGAAGETVVLGMGVGRDALIRIVGKNDKIVGAKTEVTQDYVPLNAMALTVANGNNFKPGDRVEIRRPSTAEWIDVLGTRSFGGSLSALGWKPGDADLVFERTIAAVKGNTLTIDVPLTNSLDKKYGAGTVTAFSWPGRIGNIGIEHLSLVSEFDTKNPKDEDHRWMAITMENVEDAWVRQLSFKHFAGSAVHLLETTRRVTVEDCISTEPVSEIGGQRRYTFFTRGQQTLFQRCYAANGYHDFSVGHTAAGPNAFVQCVSERPYNFSGAIDKWASGVLFDVVSVDGNAIRFGNRGQDGQGAGWAAANSLLWNCSAARIDCYKPPTAQNWALGSWSQFAGDGYWGESNNHLTPRSFYYTQLQQRLGKPSPQQSFILEMSTEASSSPSVEVAQQLTKEAIQPKVQLIDWISQASAHNPISVDAKGAKIIDKASAGGWTVSPPALQVKNGWLVGGAGNILTGAVQEVPWWNGGVEGKDLEQAAKKLAITRFVPGRVGPGLTDDLEAVVDSMKADNIVGLNQHYGLWYERRRDDHERIRRMDGEVWPPFYELPFARSGRDTAWDGLSKYDLTKYNPWYWNRLRLFATLAGLKEMVLIHQHYFQHNIIEAGAHYADFPWRTANNINNTGFNEPVNFAGDKRIFYAEQFYDLSNPVRKELHKRYVQQCFRNFSDNANVIQFIGEEFTGPLHFVKFWLDCIKEMPDKKFNPNKVGLSTTKDVQDAILKDPQYASAIDVIDIKYWHYQADGSVYAPEGGKNLAPRQWARLLKPKASSFEQVYRAVKEYRLNYPDKAVMYSADGADKFGWAVLMAGGSLPVLPATVDKELLKAATEMRPATSDGIVLQGTKGMMVYALQGSKVQADLKAFTGKVKMHYISAKTGKIIKTEFLTSTGAIKAVDLPEDAALVWISK